MTLEESRTGQTPITLAELARPGDKTTAEEATKQKAKVQPKPRRERVLIIDDDGARRALLNRTFREMGFIAIREAADSLDALVYLAEHSYDLIVVDQRSTPVDGVHMVRRLRSMPDPTRRSTPVILVAPKGGFIELDDPDPVRIDAFIDSAVTVARLEEAIEKAHVHKRRMRKR